MYHQVQEGGRGINQPKRHHKELVVVVTSPKFGLRDVQYPKPQPMVLGPKISLIKKVYT